MANKYVVDTHALIWYLEGNPKLGNSAKAILDAPDSEMILPMIALAEAIDIVCKKRTTILSVADLLNDLATEPRIRIYPLSLGILSESLSAMTIPEMHDRLIVATALHLQRLNHKTAVLTKDPAIIASALVTVIW
jgi:PIN domain nuclease of toxin-antitoxin system